MGNRLAIRIGQGVGAGTQRALPSTAATQGDDVWRETGVGRSRSRKPVRKQCGGPGWRLAGAEMLGWGVFLQGEQGQAERQEVG